MVFITRTKVYWGRDTLSAHGAGGDHVVGGQAWRGVATFDGSIRQLQLGWTCTTVYPRFFSHIFLSFSNQCLSCATSSTAVQYESGERGHWRRKGNSVEDQEYRYQRSHRFRKDYADRTNLVLHWKDQSYPRGAASQSLIPRSSRLKDVKMTSVVILLNRRHQGCHQLCDGGYRHALDPNNRYIPEVTPVQYSLWITLKFHLLNFHRILSSVFTPTTRN